MYIHLLLLSTIKGNISKGERAPFIRRHKYFDQGRKGGELHFAGERDVVFLGASK